MATRRPFPAVPILTAALTQLNHWLNWAHRELTDAIGTYGSLDERLDAIGSVDLSAIEADVDDLQDDAAALEADVAALKAPAVVTISGTTHTVSAADVRKYHRCTSASGCTITVNTSHGFEDGESAIYVQAGTGQITFVESGTTVNRAGTLKTRAQFSGVQLTCADASGDELDLVGDIEL